MNRYRTGRISKAGLLLSVALLLALSPLVRAQQGLVALYNFQEGSGTTVRDVSGVEPPLNLTIADAAAVRWLPEGGLAINTAVLIASPGPATKVIEAAQNTGSLTVEAWVKPANTVQSGPARMVGVAVDTGNRNFTLGQHRGSWAIRVRTTETSGNGIPQMPVVPSPDSDPLDPIMFTTPSAMHVVYTRDVATGQDVLYVDGVPVIDRYVGGDFSNWAANYRLGLAAELNGQRPWIGEMYRVAIYNRALSAQEVASLADELAPKLEVVSLNPEPGTLFHRTQDGLRFRILTHSNNTVAQSDVRVTLNGVDRSSQLQFTGSSSDWQVTLAGLEPNQEYQGEVEVKDDQGRSRKAALQFQTHVLREDGLLVLYTFQEGSGSVIRDLAEVGPPLNLSIADPTAVSWVQGGGLAVESPVRIASSATDLATKIRQPIEASQALTVELWIRSRDPELNAARVLTISEFRPGFPGTEEDNSLRNFSILQEGSTYQAYLRTTTTGETGRPSLDASVTEVRAPVHLVYTRDAAGQARLYVNGVESAAESVPGEISNWLEGFRLGLAYELNQVTQAPAGYQFRHWLGEYFRVAIYNQARSAAAILQSYQDLGGNDTTPPTVPENVGARPGAAFVEVTWQPSTDDSGRVAYEVERNGQMIASFVAGTSYLDKAVAPTTAYSYRVRAVDFAQNSSGFSPAAQATTKALANVSGLVKAEFYTDISGTSLDDLRFAEAYPDRPSLTLFLPQLETPLDWGNNYGVRVTGWFVAPATGDYVFFLASDDQGEFRLSADENPANLAWIAHEPQWNAFRDWTGTERRDFGDNRSDSFQWIEWSGNPDPQTGLPLIRLQAERSYYFEALMKEGGGGDHLGVTYKLKGEADPANGSPSRMAGNVIRTFGDPDFVPPVIKTPPQSQGVVLGQSVTLNVELTEYSSAPFTFQWLRQGTALPGATNATLTLAAFQSADAGDYSVLVSNIAGATTSAAATLESVGGTGISLTNAVRAGETVRFSFTTLTGRNHVVEFKDTLTPGTWTQLRVITGDGTVQEVSADLTASTRFFRVRTDE